MISLENLDYSQVRNAITTNLYELLDNDPNKFVDYFKEIYSEHNYIVYIVSKMINDEFVKKYPNFIIEISKFLSTNNNNYSFIRSIPASFYKEYPEEYLDLIKRELCNSSVSLLNDIYKRTNDDYFLHIKDFIKDNESIDAKDIFASTNTHNLQEIKNNWDKYKNDYYMNALSDDVSIDEKRNILCRKIYNVSFDMMSYRYYQYIISYHNNELDSMTSFFKKIMVAQTEEEIIQIYNKTANIDLTKTYDDIAKKIDIDSKKTFSNISKYKVKEDLLIKTINNTKIYDISESIFNLIIHNVSASLTRKKDINTFLEDWDSLDTKGSITISASEITNKYLGHVTRKKEDQQEVYFVFTDIDEEEIFFSGTHDIGLNTNCSEYSKLDAADGKNQHFLAEQLTKNGFYDYNEVVINRFNDKSKTKKRRPTNILCFDEVNELSLMYAEYFKIPILLIDTKKCAYNNVTDIKHHLDNINNRDDLLNYVNELLSLLCGIKYSIVLNEIINTNDWEDIIINSINNYVNFDKSLDDLKKDLVIINYIEGNVNKFLNGITLKFNINNDYSDIAFKFEKLPSKISNIKENLINRIKTCNNKFEQEKTY